MIILQLTYFYQVQLIPMMPPRPNKKIVSLNNLNSQENQAFFVVKKISQQINQLEKNALKASNTNTIRPISSKLSQRNPKNNSRTHKRLSTSIRLAMKSENNSQQKQQEQVSRRENNLVKFPKITSRFWGVYQMKSKRFISGNQTNKRIQVASLTKIMNLVTLVSLLNSYDLDAKKIKIAVSEWACTMIGTTASLRKRDIVTLEDLMYGMMLPSGNDAACQIAMAGGTIIKLAEINRVKKIYDRLQIQGMIECRSNIVRYLVEMNKISRIVGMENSKWSNTHGLSNKDNKTTIEDMSLLCKTAMQSDYIRKIVNTKIYSCEIQSYFGSQGTKSRIIQWQNTNKMLHKGWNGIKTGITPNAGPCLAASLTYSIDNKKYQYLVIIASCATLERRWEQVEQIANWAIFHDTN